MYFPENSEGQFLFSQVFRVLQLKCFPQHKLAVQMAVPPSQVWNEHLPHQACQWLHWLIWQEGNNCGSCSWKLPTWLIKLGRQSSVWKRNREISLCPILSRKCCRNCKSREINLCAPPHVATNSKSTQMSKLPQGEASPQPGSVIYIILPRANKDQA